MGERKNVFDGAKVKSLLDENGLTAVEIARKAGISRVQMSSYMHGRRNPKRITVQRIADALHVNISEISGYRDDDPMTELVPTLLSVTSGEYEEGQNARIYRFAANLLAQEVEKHGQSEVAKRIGISQSTCCTLINGKSDIRNLPLSAFLKLCPMLIRFDIAGGDIPATISDAEALQAVKRRIHAMVEQLTALQKANAVEVMLKGLVGE